MTDKYLTSTQKAALLKACRVGKAVDIRSQTARTLIQRGYFQQVRPEPCAPVPAGYLVILTPKGKAWCEA